MLFRVYSLALSGDQEKDAGPVTVMCKFLKNNYVRMRAKFRNVTKMEFFTALIV